MTYLDKIYTSLHIVMRSERKKFLKETKNSLSDILATKHILINL